MATATFVGNKASHTETLTASPIGGLTTGMPSVKAPSADVGGKRLVPIYILQSGTTYRLIGYEPLAAGAAHVTTWACQDR